MSFLTEFLPSLINDVSKPSTYFDKMYDGTSDQYFKDLSVTTTLYIGNLSFYTSEEQIYAYFSKVGPIKKFVMGLDRAVKTPCGFCFIEYHNHEHALFCKKYLDGMKLDERFIRIDYDYGFKEGRQFGRGRRGGQVRDEHRNEYDEGRGGWGPRGSPQDSFSKRRRD